MNYKYVKRIKYNLSSNKKTINILDGIYKSIFNSNSLYFDNLRKYYISDDSKHIDWKSSIKHNELLLKQYEKESNHNILIYIDESLNMEADTYIHEKKKEIALLTAATIGYLAINNNDFLQIISTQNTITYNKVNNNLNDLERLLQEYKTLDKNLDLNIILDSISRRNKNKQIIILITDLNNINQITIKSLKQIKAKNNLIIINIEDNYIYGENIFNISNNSYIPKYFSKDMKLHSTEIKVRNIIKKQNTKKLYKFKIPMTTIASEKDINTKLIKLLEEYKYVNK